MELNPNHLSYRVADLDGELSFLGVLTSFEIFHRFQNEAGSVYGYMIRLTGGFVIELFKTSAELVDHANTHFCFRVENLQDFHDVLTKSLPEVSEIFLGRTDRVPQFFVKSPGGFKFEFHGRE
jgi:hypothetical protein